MVEYIKTHKVGLISIVGISVVALVVLVVVLSKFVGAIGSNDILNQDKEGSAMVGTSVEEGKIKGDSISSPYKNLDTEKVIEMFEASKLFENYELYEEYNQVSVQYLRDSDSYTSVVNRNIVYAEKYTEEQLAEIEELRKEKGELAEDDMPIQSKLALIIGETDLHDYPVNISIFGDSDDIKSVYDEAGDVFAKIFNAAVGAAIKLDRDISDYAESLSKEFMIYVNKKTEGTEGVYGHVPGQVYCSVSYFDSQVYPQPIEEIDIEDSEAIGWMPIFTYGKDLGFENENINLKQLLDYIRLIYADADRSYIKNFSASKSKDFESLSFRFVAEYEKYNSTREMKVEIQCPVGGGAPYYEAAATTKVFDTPDMALEAGQSVLSLMTGMSVSDVDKLTEPTGIIGPIYNVDKERFIGVTFYMEIQDLSSQGLGYQALVVARPSAYDSKGNEIPIKDDIHGTYVEPEDSETPASGEPVSSEPPRELTEDEKNGYYN